MWSRFAAWMNAPVDERDFFFTRIRRAYQVIKNGNYLVKNYQEEVDMKTPKRTLMYEPYEKVLDALRAAWAFIENVTEDDPERNEKFFALRSQVRGALPTPMTMGSCPKCDVMMEEGVALENTISVVGMPDFPGEKNLTTMSVGGPGKMVPCMKCPLCGHSEKLTSGMKLFLPKEVLNDAS